MNGTLDKVLTLRRVPLFKGLSFEELVSLARIASVKHAAAGSTIFRQGDAGTTLFVVLSGEVEIVREAKGSEVRVTLVRPGGYFGEMALLDERPRSASARASASTILLQIQKDHFRALLATHVNLTMEILKMFAQRLRQNTSEMNEQN